MRPSTRRLAHVPHRPAGDADLGWLALRVAMLGVDFEVHEPLEPVDHLRALAERLERATGREPVSR